ncbi:MAG: penicillin-binding protein 2 [bacterium]
MTDIGFASFLRRRILFLIIVGFSITLIVQLFKMQILDTELYKEKADENSVKKTYITAPRGVLFDRNNKLLVSNKPSFIVEITPSDYSLSNNHTLETILDLDSGYVDKLLRTNKRYSDYIPRKIFRDAQFNFIAWYEENSEKLPGLNYRVELKRDYSMSLSGSHIFGYTKEITTDLLQKQKDFYELGDYIGFTGLEKYYEKTLRGEKGYKYILVDSRQKVIGRYLEGEKDKEPVKGYDLMLTIDSDAQLTAEIAFNGRKGALVAVEPATGEILAFVSSPEFDLKDFSSVTSREMITKLNTDPDNPLFNRATMSRYPPGSTYKMLCAIAALEEGIIDESFTVNCSGGMQYGDKYFACTHVHGNVNVVSAIEKSCNTFFYQLILKVGLEKWSEYSNKFGFGKKTGVDITEESAGLIPSTKYYNKVYGKGRWTKGFLVSLGIGQGEIVTSPLQLAQYTALIANNGRTKTPHFVKAFIKNEEQEVEYLNFDEINVGISQRTLDIVKEGMFLAVQGSGTATGIRVEGLNISGKTGTAQNPHGDNHSLFVCYAPSENPKIAIAVILENAGYGSTYAAPLAQQVILSYLRKNKTPVEQSDLITELRR